MAVKYSFSYSEHEKDDLYSIFEYIAVNLSNIKAANDLFIDINSAIDDLCTFPNSAPIMDNEYIFKKGIRKKLVDNYLILYYPDDLKKVIVIVRIIYAKMNFNEIIKTIDI